MDIVSVAKKRVATKSFNPNYKLSKKQLEEIEDLLVLSPSSVNIQPWHFIVVTSSKGKEDLTQATQGFFSFNTSKILNASAVIVFASKIDMEEKYLRHLLNKEDTDGRFLKPAFKKQGDKGRKTFIDLHHYDYKDLQHWLDAQVYLNAGYFTMGISAMGLDSLIMEGFMMHTLDDVLELRKNGYTSLLMVAIGKHENDFNAVLPKSRLHKDELLTRK